MGQCLLPLEYQNPILTSNPTLTRPNGRPVGFDSGTIAIVPYGRATVFAVKCFLFARRRCFSAWRYDRHELPHAGHDPGKAFILVCRMRRLLAGVDIKIPCRLGDIDSGEFLYDRRFYFHFPSLQNAGWQAQTTVRAMVKNRPDAPVSHGLVPGKRSQGCNELSSRV
jgi:hypothetical protein